MDRDGLSPSNVRFGGILFVLRAARRYRSARVESKRALYLLVFILGLFFEDAYAIPLFSATRQERHRLVSFGPTENTADATIRVSYI